MHHFFTVSYCTNYILGVQEVVTQFMINKLYKMGHYFSDILYVQEVVAQPKILNQTILNNLVLYVQEVRK